jgi:hypothetical protein
MFRGRGAFWTLGSLRQQSRPRTISPKRSADLLCNRERHRRGSGGHCAATNAGPLSSRRWCTRGTLRNECVSGCSPRQSTTLRRIVCNGVGAGLETTGPPSYRQGVRAGDTADCSPDERILRGFLPSQQGQEMLGPMMSRNRSSAARTFPQNETQQRGIFLVAHCSVGKKRQQSATALVRSSSRDGTQIDYRHTIFSSPE